MVETINEKRKGIEVYGLLHSASVTREYTLTSFQNYLQITSR